MAEIKNGVIALLLFVVIMALFTGMYKGIEEGYNITRGANMSLNISGEVENGNIVEQLSRLSINEDIAQIKVDIIDAQSPASTLFDIAGAFIGIGTGLIKVIIDLVTLPFSIIDIILTFYVGDLPAILIELFLVIVAIVSFVLLSSYQRWEI